MLHTDVHSYFQRQFITEPAIKKKFPQHAHQVEKVREKYNIDCFVHRQLIYAHWNHQWTHNILPEYRRTKRLFEDVHESATKLSHCITRAKIRISRKMNWLEYKYMVTNITNQQVSFESSNVVMHFFFCLFDILYILRQSRESVTQKLELSASFDEKAKNQCIARDWDERDGHYGDGFRHVSHPEHFVRRIVVWQPNFKW